GIDAMAQLGADPAVCGVAFVNVNWAWSGGYTYLHRDIPMFLARTPEEFGEVAPGVNALLVDESIAPGLNVFAVEWCRQGMCLARRPGPCVPVPVPTINAQLAAGRP
ncbi:MAG TPA: hypothetical protein VEA63_14565, partial [Opitutus sp.]|nr:hypothetical protein [Opitutus sp.]